VDHVRRLLLCSALLATVVTLPACSSGPMTPTGARSHVLQVAAAENFWGSIASQLGGDHVEVTSIVDSPDADPHDYEPTTADARTIAAADVVLVNGVGYDAWASKIAAANDTPGQTVLDVGKLLGLTAGANPHRWYNPDDVSRVVSELTADYQRVDPDNATYFAQRRTAFDTTGTAAYRAAIDGIKTTYAGTPIGASESIVAMLTPALGLDLVTPPDFLRAISEGDDPTPADKALIDKQISGKQIAVYVYNSQNATPDIQAQVDEAKEKGIPVSSITETLVPADASWQDWQTAQLDSLRSALAKATGR
jgi:zinc/manganese transport system substrate-binding protein